MQFLATATTTFYVHSFDLPLLPACLKNGGPMAGAVMGLSMLMVGAGVLLIFLRPHLSVRLGYSVLTILPATCGLAGSIAGAMKAFTNMGTSGLRDGHMLMSALGEVSVAFTLGLFGSAVVMTLAAILWIVPVRKPPQPPPLPS